MIPELRVFGESDLDREFRRFCEIWSSEQPGDSMVVRLLAKMADPVYLAEFGFGVLEGVMVGGGAHLRTWRDDLQSTVRVGVRFLKDDALVVIPVGTAVSLYEFFRTDFDPKTSGQLSPAVEAILERLKIIHEYEPVLAMLDVLNEKTKDKSLLVLFNIAGQDIWDTMKAAGWGWARSFLLLTDEAEKQGQKLGELLGAAIVELVRAFVEPPELSMAELITLLDLHDDEVAELTASG
jgi:hypothetical protein